MIYKLTNVFEKYSFLIKKKKKKGIEEFKNLFKLDEDNTIKKGSPRDIYQNKILSFVLASMVTNASDEYQNADGLNGYHLFMQYFYHDFQERLNNLLSVNQKYINSTKNLNNYNFDIGEQIDMLIDGMLSNLGKSNIAANKSVITPVNRKNVLKNDMLGFLKCHINDEAVFNSVCNSILNKSLAEKNVMESVSQSIKTNIKNTRDIINKNLDLISQEPEIIKVLCKTIVKLKMYKYFEEKNPDNYNKEKIGVYLVCHVLSTTLMIPLMLDLYNVSSTFGSVAMRSAEYVSQYYKVLYKLGVAQNESKLTTITQQQQNLLYLLSKIFGKNYYYFLDSSMNTKKTFKNKKDYQKYLETEIGDENSQFKNFFDCIMKVQAHKTKQEFFYQHLQNINQIQGQMLLSLEKNKVVNPSNFTNAHKNACIDNDVNKEKIINDFLTDSNIVYQDMFASDLDSTGKIYSFNKQLGGNNILNWFTQNNIAVRQAST